MTVLTITDFTTQVEWLIRIIVTTLYDTVIDYERAIQCKSTGVRIHIVVAVASALFMIVFRYGFYDLLTINEITLDPSRITVQIVTGISFIGAGTILVRHEQVSSLTAAVGVWAISAIGVAVGSGLYITGVLATIFIFSIQMLFHDDSIISRIIIHARFNVQIICINTPSILNQIQNELGNSHAESIAIKALNVDDEQIAFNVGRIINNKTDENNIIVHLRKYSNIKRIIYTRGGKQDQGRVKF